MDEKAKKLQQQREREQLTMELTIRRIEMLLLEKLGVGHIDFIKELGLQVRNEFGL